MNQILIGDARDLMASLAPRSIDLSFWSPPYYVGRSYEQYLTFEEWQDLLRKVISLHKTVLKPGGFMVVNISDILCYPDPTMPRFQADNVRRKACAVTRQDVLDAKDAHPSASRYQLANI